VSDTVAQILVIDDEPSLRTMIRQILECEGHRVLEAAEGSEGIRLQKRTPSDLIISDILMPDKEGLETIMELRRQFPAIDIIAISGGLIGFDVLDVAKKLGARYTLAKPFSLPDLLKAVRSSLEEKTS